MQAIIVFAALFAVASAGLIAAPAPLLAHPSPVFHAAPLAVPVARTVAVAPAFHTRTVHVAHHPLAVAHPVAVAHHPVAVAHSAPVIVG